MLGVGGVKEQMEERVGSQDGRGWRCRGVNIDRLRQLG